MDETTLPRELSHGGFFTIDRRTWKLLCGLEDINMLVSYLTIATGTGKGNRRSRWSAEAIQKYTGLACKRAKPAIGKLIAANFLSVAESSTASRPVYELQSFDVVLEAGRSGMSGDEQYTLRAVRERRLTKSQRSDAEILAMRGLLWLDGDSFSADPPTLDAAADLIWLPNTLVTGTVKEEASPVRRLRQCRDLDALRLLIDLYHAQHLASDGGISRAVLQRPYRRKRWGHCGNRYVWGFTPGTPTVSFSRSTEFFWQRAKVEKNQNAIWDGLHALIRMGLVMEVAHLVEHEHPDSEPIIACAWNGEGEPLERRVAEAANAAARRMLAEEILDRGADDNDALIPVWDTLPEVQMVGIFRLHYRAHTRATRRWLRQMDETAREWLADYDQLAQRQDEDDDQLAEAF